MTLFSTVLAGLGLSQRVAAELLGVRLDTVKSWSMGRNPVPAGAWQSLWALADRQGEAAFEAAEAWKAAGRPATVELGLAADDDEARQLGWPSAGAHLAVHRRVWELVGDEARIVVVPRGSTVATAAAAGAAKGAR